MDLRSGRGGRDEDRKFFSALGEELAKVVRLTVRYDTPDDTGETRRQRNERFGVNSPTIDVPDAGEFFLDAFWEISRFRTHGMNGPDPIRPADISQWSEMTGTGLRRGEFSIITEMDAAFRSAWADEAEANRARREAEQKAKGG